MFDRVGVVCCGVVGLSCVCVFFFVVGLSLLFVVVYQRDLRAEATRQPAGKSVIFVVLFFFCFWQTRGGEEHTITSQTDFTTALSTGAI